MRDAMLRQTYRLEADSHPDIYAACRTAMARRDEGLAVRYNPRRPLRLSAEVDRRYQQN